MSIKYDQEFKDMVAKEAIRVNNITATAKKHGVNPNSVSKWVNNYKVRFDTDEIQNKNKIDAEVEKDVIILKREIVDLRRQLDVTKKDLEEAKTLIGERELYIKKLEVNVKR